MYADAEMPIPTLHGTPTHQAAVELYQRHCTGTRGFCVRCGEQVPCPVRSHAASVIVAAGEDPGWYDGWQQRSAPVAELPRLADERPVTGQLAFGRMYPDHFGYAIGGRMVPMRSAGFQYERDA